jgi:2-polyprenyl-3-methyl-5-hydroxy-6-metoxy-1,4-benzoquinol methylase
MTTMGSSRDAAATHWDSHYAEDAVGERPLRPHLARALRQGIAFLDLRPGDRVLDLGCGTGGSTVELARTGADVVAVDLSPEAIQRVRSRCDDAGLANVTAVCTDAFHIAEHGPFDAVYGAMILHHLEPFADFVAELARATAPDARIFFYENNASSRTLVWFRRHVVGRVWVPKHGDDDEFPLEPREVATLRTRFDVDQEFPKMVFAVLASRYLLRGHGMAAARRVDDLLSRSDRLRAKSYRQVLAGSRRAA